jgi:hypothetical protein
MALIRSKRTPELSLSRSTRRTGVGSVVLWRSGVPHSWRVNPSAVMLAEAGTHRQQTGRSSSAEQDVRVQEMWGFVSTRALWSTGTYPAHMPCPHKAAPKTGGATAAQQLGQLEP